ncbi:MAG: hypothetical protein SH848_11645 [Saprospiraceae bacterium]|nr:hypothetical protein [Saprospiraceae bacterium]
MSKDKGSKNHKKAPADKSTGKGKAVSAYKSEGKGGSGKSATLDPFIPKTEPKSGGSHKS